MCIMRWAPVRSCQGPVLCNCTTRSSFMFLILSVGVFSASSVWPPPPPHTHTHSSGTNIQVACVSASHCSDWQPGQVGCESGSHVCYLIPSLSASAVAPLQPLQRSDWTHTDRPGKSSCWGRRAERLKKLNLQSNRQFWLRSKFHKSQGRWFDPWALPPLRHVQVLLWPDAEPRINPDSRGCRKVLYIDALYEWVCDYEALWVETGLEWTPFTTMHQELSLHQVNKMSLDCWWNSPKTSIKIKGFASMNPTMS